MFKRTVVIFLVIFLGGLFLPLVSLAGSYQINSYTVEYDGFVPCGKCLKITEPLAGISLEKQMANAAEYRCGEKKGGLYTQIYLNCQLCHFFVMVNDVLSFLLTKIVPPVAVLMLVIGGVFFYFGGANPGLVSRGKKLLVSVMIGLFLIYGAYMIVGLLLKILGAANVNPVSQIFKNGVFSIDCPIEIPKP